MIVNKIAITIAKVHNQVIQRPLQIGMIKKYLKKYIYLQKETKKLLIVRDEHNSIIMEYQNQGTKFRNKKISMK